MSPMLVVPVMLALAQTAASAVDLAGRAVDPLRDSQAKLVVLLFVQADCPLSNRYAPELQRLQAAFSARGVAFWLVYPDAAETAEAVRRHLGDYDYRMNALRDPSHLLVRKSGVRVTPEAAVFAPGERLVYHGRIDDRYVELGRTRGAPASHDLEEALEAALAGRPPRQSQAPAVGCFIADLE